MVISRCTKSPSYSQFRPGRRLLTAIRTLARSSSSYRSRVPLQQPHLAGGTHPLNRAPVVFPQTLQAKSTRLPTGERILLSAKSLYQHHFCSSFRRILSFWCVKPEQSADLTAALVAAQWWWPFPGWRQGEIIMSVRHGLWSSPLPAWTDPQPHGGSLWSSCHRPEDATFHSPPFRYLFFNITCNSPANNGYLTWTPSLSALLITP